MAIITSTPASELLSGTGNDTFVFSDNWGDDTVDDATGNNTLDFSGVSQGLNLRLDSLYMDDPRFVTSQQQPFSASVNIGSSLIQNIVGSQAGDEIIGDRDNMTLWGKAGNDVIEANGNNDVVVGGPGNDFLQDVTGKNTKYLFYSDSGNDSIQDAGGWNEVRLLNGKDVSQIALYSANNVLHFGYTDSTDTIDIGQSSIGYGTPGNTTPPTTWINRIYLDNGKFLTGGDIQNIYSQMVQYEAGLGIMNINKADFDHTFDLNTVKNDPNLLAIVHNAFHS